MSRRRLVYSFLSVVFVLFLSTPVFGAGFALYEGSARGNVLGAGLTASADDASAVFYNPAGITQLKGTQVQLGFTAIYPMITVQTNVPAPAGTGGQAAGNYSSDFDSNWFFPPQGYLTYQINDKWWAGLGIFSRYGLGTEFNDPVNPGWPGRYNSTRAVIQEVEINPNIAYKINDKFSVAAGIVASYFNVTLQRELAYPPSDIDFKVAGDSWGWGWDLALQYKPTEWMQFGITYRSKIEQNVKGNVSVSRTFTPAPFINVANMSGSADITLPDTIYTGLNFNLTKTWSVGGGVYWTGWQYYDKLQLNFGAPFGGSSPASPASTTSVSPKNWANVARYMIGTEWKATPNWDLRLGYAYDTCPIPDNTLDYILPDNDRHMFSIGAGYHQAAWSVDLSYTYMAIIDRSYIGGPPTGTAPGATFTYPGKLTSGTAHLIGLTLGYKF